MYCDLWPLTIDLRIVDRSTARDFTVCRLEGICNMIELFCNRVKGFVEYDGFCPRSSTVYIGFIHTIFTKKTDQLVYIADSR